MVNFKYDFTGDGWPDILASDWDRLERHAADRSLRQSGRRRRRWITRRLPAPNTESVLMRDIDGDGVPEMVFGTAEGYAWAKPDPSNPTAPWPVRIVSGLNDPAQRARHGWRW